MLNKERIIKIIKETMKTCNRLEIKEMVEEQEKLYERLNKILKG